VEFKRANYRSKSTREDAWKDIGDEMKMPVQDLKKKMTTLCVRNPIMTFA
jgi:hypothetical protein